MRYSFIALVLGLLFATIGQAKTNCKRHKIYCKIVKLQPHLDKKRAMEISNYIYLQAKKYNLDPMLSVAILNQENRFRDVHTYEIDRKESFSCYKTSCSKVVIEQHDVADMTIAQINIRTAVDYGFDLQRLFDHDMEYAIECHFTILRDKIAQCDHLDNPWACYHSTTPKYREKYIQMVSRYL